MKKAVPYVISILIALAVGGVSALITGGNMNIYEEVLTPPLSPPSWLFPVVWAILYVLMGISAAMIYSTPASEKRSSALKMYVLSLILNFGWSIIFFNLRAFMFSFLWLILLLVSIIKTILEYSVIDKTAAYIQIPYAIWVAFAGYLNAGIWLLNP